MNKTLMLALALATGPLAACDEDTPREEAIEEAAERNEEIAEERAEANGLGPLDQRIQGEIAETRAELAGAVGDDPSAQSTDGRTAAQRLNDLEEGEELEDSVEEE